MNWCECYNKVSDGYVKLAIQHIGQSYHVK